MNYKNRRWYRLREHVLKRDEYICQECKRYGSRDTTGLPSKAEMVHHIYPVSEVYELRYTSANLISLCNSCHGKMHDRVTDEITGNGVYWQRKRKRELGI